MFDGFRVDTRRRIWTGAADGVHSYDPDGGLIGKVRQVFDILGFNEIFQIFATADDAVASFDAGSKLAVEGD